MTPIMQLLNNLQKSNQKILKSSINLESKDLAVHSWNDDNIFGLQQSSKTCDLISKRMSLAGVSWTSADDFTSKIKKTHHASRQEWSNDKALKGATGELGR